MIAKAQVPPHQLARMGLCFRLALWGYILQEYETKGVSDVHELFIHYGPAYQRKKTEQFLNNELTKRKYFIGGNYEIEIDGHGNEKKLHYLYAGDGLFAIYETYNNEEEMYYIHKDYLGSYQSITNAEGNLVEELSFDPWGRRRNPTDWSFNNVPESYLFDRGYTGHEHLNDFNLINMPARRSNSGGGNGRMYDPYVARFLSPDPFIQAPDYTQSYNRYSYVVNNPLKYVDPSGYDWISTGTQTGYFYIAEVTDQESLDKYIEDTGDYSGSTYLFAEGIVNSPNYCSLWLKADGTKEGLLDEVEIFANGNYGVNMADWRQLLGSMQGQGSTGGGDDYSLFFDGSAGGGDIVYDGVAWFGTNFIGPGDNVNPFTIPDPNNKGSFLQPKDAIDAAAQRHDLAYWKAGVVWGPTGAVFNKDVAVADLVLATKAYMIMQSYHVGGIDNITGSQISQRTYNLAQGVYYLFMPLSINKIRP